MKKKLLMISAVILLVALVSVFALGDLLNPSFHPAELKLTINKKAEAGTEPVWYPDNTAGVKGISLRDYDPSLTDKWYHVVPVDVSRNGKQSIYLLASAMYYIGTVTVEVKGDAVTTTYTMPDSGYYSIYPKGECLKWFTSMEEITTGFLENPTSDMQFGTAVSREKDLGGQSIALLFICNRVTYSAPLNKAGDCLVRYYKTAESVRNYQAECMKMLEKMNEERAAKAAAEAEAAARAAAEAAAAEAAAAAAAEAEAAETAAATDAAENPDAVAETASENASESTEETTGSENTAAETTENAEEAATEAAENAEEPATEATEAAEEATTEQ